MSRGGTLGGKGESINVRCEFFLFAFLLKSLTVAPTAGLQGMTGSEFEHWVHAQLTIFGAFEER